jgi:hypothetical protein
MAEGPVFVILDMIALVIRNTLNTIFSLFGLSGDLLSSLSLVSAAGGGLGLIIVLVILAAVGFFIVKFLFGSMKTVSLLILAGLAILAFLFIGSAVV